METVIRGSAGGEKREKKWKLKICSERKARMKRGEDKIREYSIECYSTPPIYSYSTTLLYTYYTIYYLLY